MEKKVYVKPSIKASVIECETLMAGSGVTNVTDSRPSGETGDGGGDNQFAKENNNFSVWDED